MLDDSSRKKQILDILAEKILSSLPQAGEFRTPVNVLVFVRKNEGFITSQCLCVPLASLIIQGRKKLDICGDEIQCSRGDCLVSCIDTPHASTILDASAEKPFLSLFFLLDKQILSDLAGEMALSPVQDGHAPPPLNSQPAQIDFMKTILRLVEICDTPTHVSILAPLLLRELHYLLLCGPQGKMLRELYLKGSRDNRIIEAIAWLKSNATVSISIEALARKVHMSVSSLHRHFKNVTGYSPLQYHKQLRLYEAQRLMLTENERADRAAMAVGYESITQFNREYKRMFGLPPHRDILKRKSSA